MTTSDSLADRFSKDFVFGVATSSYQIEGATQRDGRGPSIWDAFSNMPGRVYQQHNGDVACEHYDRYNADLDLIRDLGVDAYRFSIAWPRILPTGTGTINEKGLDFYDRLVDGALERGLKTFATLYHWDLPLALMGYGGWTDRNTAHAFAEYTRIVVQRFGDRLDTLTTFNEPWCSCHHSHLNGAHAPGEKSLQATMEAIHVTNLAHGLSVQAARAERAELPMGVVINAHSVSPGSQSREDANAAERFHQFHNGVFFEPMFAGHYDEHLLSELQDLIPIQQGDMESICQPLDFWGFNYYTPLKVVEKKTANSVFPHAQHVRATQRNDVTDIGWEIDAGGMMQLLRDVYQRYELPPCYITENGACYNTDIGQDGTVDDRERIQYMDEHIRMAADIVDAGIDLRGYFAWSLMDNFEWAEGYKMRFGLVHVDFDTQVRTLKNSALWYRDLLESRH